MISIVKQIKKIDIDIVDMLIIFRKFHLNDLNKILELFKDHLFYIEQDKKVDHSSPKKVVKRLLIHQILSNLLNFFGLMIV